MGDFVGELPGFNTFGIFIDLFNQPPKSKMVVAASFGFGILWRVYNIFCLCGEDR